jgi:tetratricopeptide (TPR) repeat protein
MGGQPNRAASIFEAAVDLGAAAERAAYLDAACGQDLQLRAEVEELLKHDDAAGSFLDLSAPSDPQATTDAPPVSECPGTVIGPYKLLEQIGEGGFGVVFLAEQTQPVRRKVALKVLKPGMDTRQVVARFEAERQALAIMDHPQIAKVFDGGATPSGRPYFVMELVKGVPITDFCDQNHLTPRQRLELFVPVCQAVQHAHQKGIIHRDLKPSNVLVSRHDATPVVKVIDFGVAKALGQELTDKTLFTGVAQMIGTPLYMSPEQAGMSDLDIDTRSDIYSLGVLLYELLTGSTPFTKERFKQAAYEEIRRIIREEEPPRPSTRMSTLDQAATTASEQRRSDPRKLSRLFRGELDWIVMKALEKDRNRRYETANGLARDIERYLHDEPVLACPPSTGYRLRKFARKYKKGLATVAAFLALLVAGQAGFVLWRLHEAEQRATETKQALDQLSAANDLIQSGRFYAEVGQWARAQKDFTRAVKLRGDHSLVWFERGDFYGRLGLWDRAAKDYVAAFELKEPATPRQWFSQALLCAYGGDQDGYRKACAALPQRFTEKTYFGAENELIRACTLAPVPGLDLTWARRLATQAVAGPAGRTGPNSHALGLIQYRAGDYKKAVQTLSTYDPQWASWLRGCHNHFVRAMAHHRLSQAKKAREALKSGTEGMEQAIQRLVTARSVPFPEAWHDWLEALILYREAITLIDGTPPVDDERLLVVRGRALAALEEAGQAKETCDRGRQHRPNDPQVLLACFLIYGDLREWDRANGQYARLGRLFPRRFPRELERFGYQVLRGNWDKARAEFARVFQKGHTDPALRIAAGHLYFQESQWFSALDCYREALGFDRPVPRGPESIKARLAEAAAFRKKGILTEAITAYSDVNRFNPDQVEVHFNLGKALWRRKLFEEAIAQYSQVIKLDPKSHAAWCDRGGVYKDMGQYEKAVADCSRALELNPKCRWARQNRAFAFKRLKQWDRAIADYSKEVKLVPRSVFAWDDRGDVYFEMGQYAKAAADYSKAIELYPDYARPWNSRGAAFHRLGQYDKAVADYSKALEKNPKDAVTWNNRGDAYNHLHQYQQAIADFSEAIKLDPMYSWAWFNRGDAFQELRQYDKAIADYSRAIELHPTCQRKWCGRGAAFMKVRRYDKAIADYSRALKLNPTCALTLTDRGSAYAGLKQWDKAITDFSKAIELDPKDAWQRVQRGTAYLQLRQYAKAIADYSRAIDLEPKDAVAWNNRGSAYSRLKQWDKAIVDYSKAIELNLKRPMYWKNRGYAYKSQGQYAKAIADFSKAIELDPKDPAPWNNRGLAYAGLGQWDKAITDYSKAIELKPNDASVWNLRGVAYARLGQWAKALADGSKAVALMPRIRLYWSNRAYAYVKLGQPEKAQGDFAKAAELAGKDANAWVALGQVHQELRRWEPAIQHYSKAIELDPKFTRAWNNRGIVYAGLGQWDKAIADYSRAIDLDPKVTWVWNARANVYSALGQWDKAAADYARLIDSGPPNDIWFQLACVRLLAGDAKGYEQLRKQLPERVAQAKNPVVSYVAARACMISPKAVADPLQAVRWAEKAVASQSKTAWYLHVLGAVHYRAGQFDPAVRRCRESLKAQPSWPGNMLNWLVLAMAEHRLGHAGQARQWLAKAIQWRGKLPRQEGKGVVSPPDSHPSDWLEFNVLFREAQALIPAEKQ